MRLAEVLLAGCALLFAGCTFEGWVPKGRPIPAEQAEREIADLDVGKLQTAELECMPGSCRARHRLLISQPGRLRVTVDGPVRTGGPGNGPRIVRALLEGADARILDRRYGDEGAPLRLEGDVVPGRYFVLVQVFGGRVEYTLQAKLADSLTPIAQATETGAAASAPQTAPAEARSVPGATGAAAAGVHRTGDISDGADFAYDPSVAFSRVRGFAFAQDPARELAEGREASSGNPFVVRAVQREVRFALARVGVDQVAASEADFLVSVHVGSQSTTSYMVGDVVYERPYDDYMGRWTGMGLYVKPHTYVDGTLVIDFIDPRNGQLVWHGWTSEPIPVAKDNEAIIKQAVAKVLAQFPPG